MSTSRIRLRKLIEAARRAQTAIATPLDFPAPFGFSTRVATRWAEAGARSGWADAWERLSWWAAGASVAVCLLAFVSQSLQPDPNPFDVLIEAPADVVELM